MIEFWDPTIKKAGLDDTVVVAVTNTKKLGPISLTAKRGRPSNLEMMSCRFNYKTKHGKVTKN